MKHIAFIIPLKSPQSSRNWNHTVALAIRCLSSVFNQTSDNYSVYLSCNSFPFHSTTKKLKIIEGDYPVPNNWETAHFDKYRKIHRALIEARKAGPCYVMKLDADDLVHKDLARFVSDRSEDGFIIDKGFFYSDGMRTIQADNAFNRVCGSSSMIWLEQDEFPSSMDDNSEDFDILKCGHNIFREFYTERNKALGHIPFRAAIYVSGNGENISGHNIKSIQSRKKTALSLLKRRPLTLRHASDFSILNISHIAHLVSDPTALIALPIKHKAGIEPKKMEQVEPSSSEAEESRNGRLSGGVTNHELTDSAGLQNALLSTARSVASRLSRRSVFLEKSIVRTRSRWRRRHRRSGNCTRIADSMSGNVWSDKWNLELPFEYSAKISKKPMGAGNCIRFEWRSKDYDGSRPSMSAEFSTGHLKPEGSSRCEFEVFIPSELQNYPVPIIFSQLHGTPDFHLGETWRHPISEIRLEKGSLHYICRGSELPIVPRNDDRSYAYTSVESIKLGEPVYNEWNRIGLFESLDPLKKKGRVEIALNENRSTRSHIHIGYNDVIGPFWKFGVYLPVIIDGMKDVSLFFKNVRFSRV